jgi:hypothetical protein
MNIVTLLAIIFLISLIYSLIQSHNNIERELREIRMKCVMPTNSNEIAASKSGSTPASTSVSYSNPTNNPYKVLKSSLVSGLTSLLPTY